MISLDNENQTDTVPTYRQRKVYSSYYQKDHGKPHPMIRMHGKYLASLGFNAGDTIEVKLDFGQITISKPQESLEEQEP